MTHSDISTSSYDILKLTVCNIFEVCERTLECKGVCEQISLSSEFWSKILAKYMDVRTHTLVCERTPLEAQKSVRTHTQVCERTPDDFWVKKRSFWPCHITRIHLNLRATSKIHMGTSQNPSLSWKTYKYRIKQQIAGFAWFA